MPVTIQQPRPRCGKNELPSVGSPQPLVTHTCVLASPGGPAPAPPESLISSAASSECCWEALGSGPRKDPGCTASRPSGLTRFSGSQNFNREHLIILCISPVSKLTCCVSSTLRSHNSVTADGVTSGGLGESPTQSQQHSNVGEGARKRTEVLSCPLEFSHSKHKQEYEDLFNCRPLVHSGSQELGSFFWVSHVEAGPHPCCFSRDLSRALGQKWDR